MTGLAAPPPGERATATATATAAGRGALIGLAVAWLLLAAALAHHGLRQWRAVHLAAAPLAVLAVVVVHAGPSFGALLVVVGAAFVSSALAAYAHRLHAVRLLLGALIVFIPLRGGWLALAAELDIRNALMLVNALPPSVVVGAALGSVVARGGIPDLRRGLGLTFAVTLAVVLLSFATQDVGLKLYGVGAAQYLTYPMAALLAATVWQSGDAQRLCLLLSGMSIVVALSTFVQAADLVEFVQAAEAQPPGQQARYGGATGSYLHAGIFLGTCIPLLAGYVLAARRIAQAAVPLIVMVLVGTALVLTAGRAGMGIAGLGLVALLVTSRGAGVRRLAIAVLIVPALAWPVASQIGLQPQRVTDRIASVVDPDEPGNAARLRDMRAALDGFRDASPAQQLLGRGLAATGNARKLTELEPEPVESYALKLLVETGVIGALLLGAVVLWGGLTFIRAVAARERDHVVRGLAAGGFGLTVDAVAFPTLEVQLLALVWWLALCAMWCSRTPQEDQKDADRSDERDARVAPSGAGGPRS